MCFTMPSAQTYERRSAPATYLSYPLMLIKQSGISAHSPAYEVYTFQTHNYFGSLVEQLTEPSPGDAPRREIGEEPGASFGEGLLGQDEYAT